MARPIILVLGSINMDIVTTTQRFPEPGETIHSESFFTAPGGKGANQAVAAARLGADTRMIGRVGGDIFGSELQSSLQTNGVDVSLVLRDTKHSSGLAIINLDAAKQNWIILVPGANGACGKREVAVLRGCLPEASALLLQLEIPMDVSLEAARLARSKGVTVILDPAPAKQLPTEFYRLADYLTPNETEAGMLAGFPVTDAASAGRAAHELLARGAGCVVIKLGGLGAYYATRQASEHLPAFKMNVVDTVAAGDAFNAALAVALAEGKALRDAVRWAMAAGAMAVTKPGAQQAMPTRREVESLLKRRTGKRV
jgi:ribokinase